MFKKMVIFSLFSLAIVGAPLSAEMANGNFGLDVTAEKANYKDKGVADKGQQELFITANKVVSGLLSALAIVFFILLTYAGVRWMTARGNEEFSTNAKNTVEAAVIGLVVTLSAYAVTTFVFTKVQESPVAISDAPHVVTGACLKVSASGIFEACEMETDQDCAAKTGYTFHANEYQSFCDSQPGSPTGTGSCVKLLDGVVDSCKITTSDNCPTNADYEFTKGGTCNN